MTEKLFDTSNITEKFVVVAIETNNAHMSAEKSLDELEELVHSSGAEVVGRMVQNREAMHPGHYLGKGKLDELRDLISLTNATGVVCDDELSPAQYKNMEQVLNTKVIDRTTVILDIFAGNAKSAEGKAQVELAQLSYRLSHLAGLGKSLSRLGGGIGTRGPGEKKLETDRRHIRNRITQLNHALKEIETRRDVLRSKREKNNALVVSMVGYTNAGKSTIMNMLADADVLAMDKLFATLDTTTRNISLPGGAEILYTDTVGFIQKLPHQLIKAFRATLEELNYADILIHVVDASNENRDEQMQVVYRTLKSLNCTEKPVITVFNKMDLSPELPLPVDSFAVRTVELSAVTGEGKEDFLKAIEAEVQRFKRKISVLIPYGEGGLLNMVHKNGEILSEEYASEGTILSAYVPPELEKRLENFIYIA